MNKTTFFLVLIGLSFSINSCTEVMNTVYSENVKIEKHRMPKDAEYTFEFENNESTQLYDVVIMFRHVDGFQFNRVVFNFSHSSQKADSLDFTLGLPIVNSKGEYVGDGSGDIWDVEHTVISKKALPQGTNVFKLKNEMDSHYEYIPNVMSVGLKVIKSE
ncbi:MAG: hypothetical protein R6U95_09650 [Bacteroidales bacterium]